MPDLIIDPQFVDVDLEAEARRLGFIPGDLAPKGQRFTQMPKGVYADYSDEFEILPDAERTKAIERLDAEGGIENLVRWILNQKSEGSCVGNAETQGIQVLMAKLFGEAFTVPLSAISAYKQIGSSPGSGAMVDDALEKGSTVGVLPLDTPENRQRFGNHVMPATGFYTAWPEGDWKKTAAQFRIKKHLIIRSVAAIEQAGINGHPIVVGRSGHSILYLRPTLKSGRGYLYVNSWNGWGFGAGGHPHGFGFDSAGMVRSSASWAFAIVDVTTPDYILAA
jgi:hypothetical protein